MPYTVTIEGNIGAGKSTILEGLAKEGIEIFPEPFKANKLLPLFYADMPRWACLTQIHFLAARTMQYMSAANSSMDLGKIVVLERTVRSDRYIFAQMLYEQGNMSEIEWQEYQYQYQIYRNFAPKPNLAIVLDISPEECLKRIHKRLEEHPEERKMEKDIPIEYLQHFSRTQRKNARHLGEDVILLNDDKLTPEEQCNVIKGIIETKRDAYFV